MNVAERCYYYFVFGGMGGGGGGEGGHKNSKVEVCTTSRGVGIEYEQFNLQGL